MIKKIICFSWVTRIPWICTVGRMRSSVMLMQVGYIQSVRKVRLCFLNQYARWRSNSLKRSRALQLVTFHVCSFRDACLRRLCYRSCDWPAAQKHKETPRGAKSGDSKGWVSGPGEVRSYRLPSEVTNFDTPRHFRVELCPKCTWQVSDSNSRSPLTPAVGQNRLSARYPSYHETARGNSRTETFRMKWFHIIVSFTRTGSWIYDVFGKRSVVCDQFGETSTDLAVGLRHITKPLDND
jgi:hypothetical protein